MLNIDLPMNFDSPYKALSIRDFWKRWHISLTKFLTEYIYIPLGGNRKGKIRTYLNTMAVFTISGLWHGANWTFVLWGILHGAFSVFDRISDKIRKNIHPAMKWMATFFVVNVLWLLFRANSITEWSFMLRNILGFENLNISGGLINAFVLPETNFLLNLTHTEYLSDHIRGFSLMVMIVFAIVLCLCFENSYKRRYRKNFFSAIVSAILIAFCLTCISSESTFVYFNF